MHLHGLSFGDERLGEEGRQNGVQVNVGLQVVDLLLEALAGVLDVVLDIVLDLITYGVVKCWVVVSVGWIPVEGVVFIEAWDIAVLFSEEVERADGDAAAFEAGPFGKAFFFVEIGATTGPFDPIGEEAWVDAVQCHADCQPAVVILAGLDVLEEVEGALCVGGSGLVIG